MSDVTEILYTIERGDQRAAEELLPLVYDELRKLAATKLARERAGQSLQATALVHEAYLRLVDVERVQHWDSRGHFFSAAAEAMRRIIVEAARRRATLKRGGALRRRDVDEFATLDAKEHTLEINDALEKLAGADAEAAELVKLRYFAGFTMKEATRVLGVSPRKAQYLWAYARCWIRREMREG